MSGELYLCVHAAEFAAQALLRLRPDLQSEPVAVLEGSAPMETVCALNQHARLHGAVHGMTRLEAETLSGLRLLRRSAESEAAARAALLECCARFSPRVQQACQEAACAFVLDVTGTERLFGLPRQLAERLRAALLAARFRASLAVSANYHAARLKAAATRGITVIPTGEEAAQLAALSMHALDLAEEPAQIFTLWGIRTLGDLAQLPEAELVARMGPAARLWQRLARGDAEHAFQPIEPSFRLHEYCELEAPAEQIDSLLFVAARMVECLVARAAARAMSLASVTLELKLEGGSVHRGAVRPALPTTDRRFLLKLIQLELGAHPPQAAVVAIALTAEAGQSSKVQLGLFAPQTPEPSRLDVTLARLKALVGDDRVGSPALEDSHRAGSFRMEGFSLGSKVSVPETAHARMSLRRIRPPKLIHMELRASKPSAFRHAEQRFTVAAVCGPWKSSGCWWSTEPWETEEWDVLAVDREGLASLCLLVHHSTGDRWCLEACYD